MTILKRKSLLSYVVSLLLLLLTTHSNIVVINGLYSDEIGLYDTLIPISGHGIINSMISINHGQYIITSNSYNTKYYHYQQGNGNNADIIKSRTKTTNKNHKSSCYVTCRNVVTGDIVWSHDVCTTTTTDIEDGSNSSSNPISQMMINYLYNDNNHKSYNRLPRHMTFVVGQKDIIITMDMMSGIIYGWDGITGNLLWDISLYEQYPLSLLNEGNDKSNNKKKIKKEKAKQTILIQTFQEALKSHHYHNDDYQFHFKQINEQIVALQWNIMDTSSSNHENIYMNIETGIIDLTYTSTTSSSMMMEYPNNYCSNDIQKKNDINFYIDNTNEIVINYVSLTIKPRHSETGIYVIPNDKLDYIYYPYCNNEYKDVIVTTKLGMIISLRMITPPNDSPIEMMTHWIHEDSLSYISSSLLLDSSHIHSQLLTASTTTSTDVNHLHLTYASRLYLQYQSFTSSMLSLASLVSSSTADNTRDYNFGFVKIAILLTPYKLIAMNTHAKQKQINNNHNDRIRYQMDILPPGNTDNNDFKHHMIHGTTNSYHHIHGINGGAHSREVLLVSTSTNMIYYKCFDGNDGNIHMKGHYDMSSTTQKKKIIQIIPMIIPSESDLLSSASCRQDAIILFNDHSVISLLENHYNNQPNKDSSSSNSVSLLSYYVQNLPSNTLFTHVVDKEASQLLSYSIEAATSSLPSSNDVVTTTQLIGSTSFSKNDETIVQIAYPNREEIIQSPCNVLGDESLLLKYLNPHIMVIVTMSSSTSSHKKEMEDDTDNSSTSAINRRRLIASTLLASTKTDSGTTKKKKSKRKPLGVTTSGDTTSDTLSTTDDPTSSLIDDDNDLPNLFINVMDTVSGRIIYRMSHHNACRHDINVLISENWIYYTYIHERTKRTELGVITLYEGMIDPKGLTAFTSINTIQSSTFTSFNVRDSKPVVLSKTYIVPKSISSLGITLSRSGISTRRLLLGTKDGQIHGIDRKVLEPRRPVGPLKDTEKKEGLFQYNELIPSIPYNIITYNITSIDNINHIISSTTDLESQTLIMSYGYDHIYITRISPSRSFDLLPESFNKLLILLVVIILCIIQYIINRMSTKKLLGFSWI